MRAGRGIAAAVVVVAVGAAAFVGMRFVGSEAIVAAPSSTPAANPSSSPSPEPVPSLAWGPTVPEWEDALATASALPVDQAAGQVLVVAWGSPDAAGAASLVSTLHAGGVILMPGSMVDVAQTAALTAAVSDAGAADGRDWPAIVSVDQEGGPVARLSGIIPDMPAFMASGSVRDKSLVTDAHRAMAADMAALGFNLDYAPVADVTVGWGEPTIRTRSAGSDPANVSATVEAATAGFIEAGVVPVIKHFPGHGSVTSDSHTSLPVQAAAVAQLESRDFIPFQSAIEAGAPVVMMAHIVVPEWGPGPSSTTPAAYAYVREELGFTGVLVTDALNMEAITASYSPGDAAVAALAAGADVLLIPADAGAAHAAIVAAVNSGTLSRERLDEAAARSILLMRWQAGLDAAPASDPSHAATFAAAAATVASATCGTPLVGSSVTISGGFQGERDALAAALAQHGIGVGGGTSVKLFGAADGSGAADVVVAMDGPWGLPNSSAQTYVGLYGRSDEALAGLAAVLAGASAPGGTWSVDVPVPFATCGG